MPWNRPPHFASIAARTSAPKLRRSTKDGEKHLWSLLRSRPLLVPAHFRRQVAIGSYVVDFVCFTNRLIVEVDGEIRRSSVDYDRQRDAYLVGQEFRVLRFTNGEVMLGAAAVLAAINAALAGATLFAYGGSQLPW